MTFIKHNRLLTDDGMGLKQCAGRNQPDGEVLPTPIIDELRASRPLSLDEIRGAPEAIGVGVSQAKPIDQSPRGRNPISAAGLAREGETSP